MNVAGKSIGTEMKWITIFGLLALLVVVGMWALRKPSGGNKAQEAGDGDEPEKLEAPWPFYAKRPLSPIEQVLYHRLVTALPEHIVLAQVQVSQILGVKRGNPFNEWNNRINRMSYDFVICAKDGRVIAAIELDDKTHERPDRVQADAKKDRATAAAGVNMIRWHAKSLPDVDAIKLQIAGLKNTTVEEERRTAEAVAA